MDEKRYPNGRRKALASRRQLTRNLWKVGYINAYEDDGHWVAHFHCADGIIFSTAFKTREELWDWVHRPVLNDAILILLARNEKHRINAENKGKYPWKIT